MKMVANFIVEKRKYMLVLFLVLAAVSVPLAFQVNVNYDMSQYLPDDSSNRIGMDIMAEEFPDQTVVLGGHESFDMLSLLIPALIVLVIVMFIMADSWIDPIVMIVNIGIAIVINMGTNFMFDSVSDLTFSVAPILQLVLSLSYSIMLINRYRQEKEKGLEKKEAMKGAVRNALLPISSSSLTTTLAMLMMLFLSFTIGTDLGLVLAKGVVISLICVFTVMPALVLMLDNVMEKTRKRALHPNMNKIAGFCYKIRYGILVFFIAVFAGGIFLARNVEINYDFEVTNGVFDVFPRDNPIIVIYENADEENISTLISQWQDDWRDNPLVNELTAYSTSLGMRLTAAELADALDIDVVTAEMLFSLYGFAQGEPLEGEVSLFSFVEFLAFTVAQDSNFAEHLGSEMTAMLQEAVREMEEGLAQMVGVNYSRLIIATIFPEESEETFAFLNNITADLENNLNGSFYLVGNSVMRMELTETFPNEQIFLTVLSVAVMILMIAIFFRKIATPLIIVSIVQAGIFISIGTILIQGSSIMFMALIIVQCILIGAATDYGILFSSYYKEARKTEKKQEAMATALTNSMPTFLTSGSILFFVPLIVGITFHDPVVSEILMVVSRGAIVAIIMVIFILPPLITIFDKFVCRKTESV